MNWLEKLLYGLQIKMNTPEMYGWFHLMWIGITLFCILLAFIFRKKCNEKSLKSVLALYGIVAFLLEFIKQVMWSFEFDPVLGVGTWDYNWYAAPFQLCTTPIYISLICLFMKKNKWRDAFLSYIAFFTILGSITTLLMPSSCFTEDILINIHTMYLHCGSLVVSCYLLFTKEVKVNINNFLTGYIVFLVLASVALCLNISFYKSGIIGSETFDMFYISPYFISVLPVYSTIQTNCSYIIFLFLYLLSIFLGGSLIYIIAYLANKKGKHNVKLKKGNC